VGGRERQAIPPEEFRRAFGHLPTGVTVLTAFDEDGSPVGMAANSVTSVSLSPPLILVCPAKSSTTWPRIREAHEFCVNFMASQHEQLCRRFAAKGSNRFADVEWHARAVGPALGDALGWVECRIETEHDAGDHTVVIAEVLAIEASAHATPLVFFQGRYGTFA
jgi:3-hydroxy-9,10-secoandrosta-1,3,5(10)-triene-9,17-dione monooxygenase reductase component